MRAIVNQYISQRYRQRRFGNLIGSLGAATRFFLGSGTQETRVASAKTLARALITACWVLLSTEHEFLYKRFWPTGIENSRTCLDRRGGQDRRAKLGSTRYSRMLRGTSSAQLPESKLSVINWFGNVETVQPSGQPTAGQSVADPRTHKG